MGEKLVLNNIDAVIFDMDGTIIDSMWVWRKVDQDFLKKRNIDLPEGLQKTIEGMSFTDTAIYFKNSFSLPEGIEDIQNEWLEMVRHYYEYTIPLKPGAYEFICNLKDDGKKIGLATSNFIELAELVLKRTGILDFFDTIVTGCEVGKEKNCPDIFLLTARKLDVSPSRCVVFEDSLSGITGALRAGMKVVAVHDEYSLLKKDELSGMVERYITNFQEIA